MDEKKIKTYFREKIRALMERSSAEPDGFRSYFADRDPRDEEILGLLAVSAMMSGEYHLSDRFPSPVEALAALSSPGRLEICREFRKELKASLRHLTAA